MEAGILDPGKVQFQEELSRWFESRGIIANLRSHLRYLMIMALQSTHTGAKTTDRSSPKAQALSLLVAEYLFRHRCHYSLSVFASEVPTLASFNFGRVAQGEKASASDSKHPKLKQRFQEDDVEEIFNALGLSPDMEELAVLKHRYLEKSNETSLVELLLQMAIQTATKLHIHQNLESNTLEGERLLSKQWSSKVVDILSREKMLPCQISAVQESIFRITEIETRKAVEEERRLQIQILTEREKRIQEHFKKYEDEIFFRLTEAEKNLINRKEMIEQELIEREEHLTNVAFEWNNKHQEILRLSKKFHVSQKSKNCDVDIENENRSCKKKLKELEEENKSLKFQEERQRRTIHELQGDMDSLVSKLKEITDSNTALHQRIEVLINRERKEVREDQNSCKQVLQTRFCAEGAAKRVGESRMILQAMISLTKPETPVPDRRNIIQPYKAFLESRTAGPIEEFKVISEDEDCSLSSSVADIFCQVQKKLKVLEEESERLKKNYLEYKIKSLSLDSDSESREFTSEKSEYSIRDANITKKTKVCQTSTEDLFAKIRKIKHRRKEKCELNDFFAEKSFTFLTKPLVRAPNKRQLKNRNFFITRRSLLEELEKRDTGAIQTGFFADESDDDSTKEEVAETSSKREHEPNLTENQVFSTEKVIEKTMSLDFNDKLEVNKKASEVIGKVFLEKSNQVLRSDKDCLALLDDARRMSPQTSARKSLQQQMLLPRSEKEMEEGQEEERSKML